MLTTLLNLIKRVLGRFSLRDAGHFAAAFVGAAAVALQTTTLPTSKAAWIALGSGALAVAFRQVFPNVSVSAAQLESYIARGEKVLVGLKQNPVQVVTSPSNTDIVQALAKIIAGAAGGSTVVNATTTVAGAPADPVADPAATAATADALASALSDVAPPVDPPVDPGTGLAVV